jgi:hypothetical protein
MQSKKLFQFAQLIRKLAKPYQSHNDRVTECFLAS